MQWDSVHIVVLVYACNCVCMCNATNRTVGCVLCYYNISLFLLYKFLLLIVFPQLVLTRPTLVNASEVRAFLVKTRHIPVKEDSFL